MISAILLLIYLGVVQSERYVFEWTAGAIEYNCNGLKGGGWTNFGSRCLAFSNDQASWADAPSICKLSYSNSAPLLEQNWLALRQIIPTGLTYWTGWRDSAPDLLSIGVVTSIYNPAWSDDDPAWDQEGDCVAIDLTPLNERSRGWTFKACDALLPVACETFACVADEFRCADNSQCLPRAFVADGVADCKDGSDENAERTKKIPHQKAIATDSLNVDCTMNPCSEHGTCGGETCWCDSGFYGKRCSLFDCTTDDQCENGGTCIGPKCACLLGFVGDACEKEANDMCISFCINDGKCFKDGTGAPYCECLESYYGDHCENRNEIPISMANLFVTSKSPNSSLVFFPAVQEFAFCGWINPWKDNLPHESGLPIVTLLGEVSTVTLSAKWFFDNDFNDTFSSLQYNDLQFTDNEWNQIQSCTGRSFLLLSLMTSKCRPDNVRALTSPRTLHKIQNRLVIVSWTEPVWKDKHEIASVESNFRNGDVFYWGSFHIVYTARDGAGNVGRCEFDLFIAPYDCVIPDYKQTDDGTMYLQYTDYDDVGSYVATYVKCTDKRFPLPGPQFYICDAMGQWHRSVAAPTITLPICGTTVDAHPQTLRGVAVYDTRENCAERHDELERSIEETLNQFAAPCTDGQTARDDCYEFKMTYCNDPNPQLLENPLHRSLQISNNEHSMLFLFSVSIQSSDPNFNTNIDSAIESVVDPEHAEYDVFPTEFFCPVDHPVHVTQATEHFCTQTTPGNFIFMGQSQPCPIGQYSIDYSVSECTPCPGNFTTAYEGATSEEDCFANCPPGYFTTYIDRSKCTPCGVGTYSDKEGSLGDCISCRTLSTKQIGSTSEEQCVNTCDHPGEELDVDESCRKCKQGTYKNTGSLRCDSNCPTGLTTAGNGSLSINDCTVINCPRNRRVASDLPPPNPSSFNLDVYCPLCDRGFAQALTNQTLCAPCIEFNDAASYSTCSSECKGTDDQSCGNGKFCSQIVGSQGYYECVIHDNKPDSDNASSGLTFWQIVLIASGSFVVCVLLVAAVLWLCIWRGWLPDFGKPVPSEEVDNPARRSTGEAPPVVPDAVRGLHSPSSNVEQSHDSDTQILVQYTTRENDGLPYQWLVSSTDSATNREERLHDSYHLSTQSVIIRPPERLFLSNDRSRPNSPLNREMPTLESSPIQSRKLGTAQVIEYPPTPDHIRKRPALTVQTTGLEPESRYNHSNLPSLPSGLTSFVKSPIADRFSDLASSAFYVPSLPTTPLPLSPGALQRQSNQHPRMATITDYDFDIPLSSGSSLH